MLSGVGWGGVGSGLGSGFGYDRVGYLTSPYHTILLQIFSNQHTFTYLPTYLPKHMPYPTIP